MDGEVRLQVSMPVERDAAGDWLVIVRVLQGDARLGGRLHSVRDVSGAERPVDLTVRRIWFYGREIDRLGPGSTGKLQIGGDAGGVGNGSVLVGRCV
ncbi:hypothetical protein BJF79_10980 [Actinomadura sp. CNU-125]|uniref:hypothetical protein n=1 Tax=Actinomadura sp. CNU-125 TaxID=1904961 RepID=UPI00095D004B|nr:hypothetical protein [Actinomadura sp. CNU-125]OLT28350.1 hypothetical protein BJF79_10980 [Actinomadura sp. CNU-125]